MRPTHRKIRILSEGIARSSSLSVNESKCTNGRMNNQNDITNKQTPSMCSQVHMYGDGRFYFIYIYRNAEGPK